MGGFFSKNCFQGRRQSMRTPNRNPQPSSWEHSQSPRGCSTRALPPLWHQKAIPSLFRGGKHRSHPQGAPATAEATQSSHSSLSFRSLATAEVRLPVLTGSRSQLGETASICLEVAGRGTPARASGGDVLSARHKFSHDETPLSPVTSSAVTQPISE